MAIAGFPIDDHQGLRPGARLPFDHTRMEIGNVPGIICEWRRLSCMFVDINGRACAAAEDAKASMLIEPSAASPLTVAKFDEAVDISPRPAS